MYISCSVGSNSAAIALINVRILLLEPKCSRAWRRTRIVQQEMLPYRRRLLMAVRLWCNKCLLSISDRVLLGVQQSVACASAQAIKTAWNGRLEQLSATCFLCMTAAPEVHRFALNAAFSIRCAFCFLNVLLSFMLCLRDMWTCVLQSAETCLFLFLQLFLYEVYSHTPMLFWLNTKFIIRLDLFLLNLNYAYWNKVEILPLSFLHFQNAEFPSEPKTILLKLLLIESVFKNLVFLFWIMHYWFCDAHFGKELQKSIPRCAAWLVKVSSIFALTNFSIE